ncbi:hypothetical protein BN1708_019274, partial [Verticillium longisporum]
RRCAAPTRRPPPSAPRTPSTACSACWRATGTPSSTSSPGPAPSASC